RHRRRAARRGRRSRGGPRSVRRAERRDRYVYDRSRAARAGRRADGVLSDGAPPLAPERRHAREPVLRKGDADLRRFPLKLSFTKHTLANGLDVLLHEDHACPIVAVNIWYHVGSKNETPGRTGFAHLFEHMMFQGFKGYDLDYIPAIQEFGGAINGSTTEDRTNYWELVPSNFLETALFMEAGRMGGLLDAMTQAKLDNQRDVVKNEKRQRIDNQPYGQVNYRIPDVMYPEGHPYHWTVIGSMEDLTAASLDDVKGFFRHYYVPNNASLVV